MMKSGYLAQLLKLQKLEKIFDIPVEISHIGSMAGFGQMEQLLKQVDGYRMNGMDITCDCYPYFAFSTRIGATTYDDGWLERYHCDYDACQLMEGKYKGQRCTPETFARDAQRFSGVFNRLLRDGSEGYPHGIF